MLLLLQHVAIMCGVGRFAAPLTSHTLHSYPFHLSLTFSSSQIILLQMLPKLKEKE